MNPTMELSRNILETITDAEVQDIELYEKFGINHSVSIRMLSAVQITRRIFDKNRKLGDSEIRKHYKKVWKELRNLVDTGKLTMLWAEPPRFMLKSDADELQAR